MSDAERGGATVELTLIAPVLVLLLLFVVALGRLAQARADVDGAARDAARAASIRRSPAAAAASAEAAAAASLAERKVTCSTLNVHVDTAGFGPGGSVAVDVACAVDLADLSLLRVPGAKTVQARSVAVVDAYRSSG